MKPVPPKKPPVKPVQKKQAGNTPQMKMPAKLELPLARKWMIIMGLILFTFVIYGNSIWNSYSGDDAIITTQNHFVQEGAKGIGQIFAKGFLYGFNQRNDQSYRPITLTFMAVEKQMFGESPLVHHFFNVFWYAITAVFLFLTLLKVFRKYNYIVPLLITVLFIAHPIHTEVVANIKSRDEILSFLFCIIAVYCSMKYYIYDEAPTYVVLSWVFFFLSILSKETVLTYAFVIPMVYYYFTDFKPWKLIVIGMPFVGVVLLYMIIRLKVLTFFTFDEQMIVINNSLMAAHNWPDRLATTIFILGKYIYLLFVPYSLTWDYSYNQIPVVSLLSPQALISIAVYAGLIVYAIMGLKKKDPISFGIFYFIITMSVVSNLFIKIGSTMGERFLYTSSLGFCIAIAFIIVRLLKIQTDAPRPKVTSLYIVAGVILVPYSIRTITRNPDWKNNFALFSSAANISTNSARAHQAIAFTYTDSALKVTNANDRTALFNKAIPEYYAALKILPDYSEALYNLGWNYYSMGDLTKNNASPYFDSAKVSFEKCIKADPVYINAYNNLGVIYFNRKDYGNAIFTFEKGLQANPNNAGMYENLGAAFYNLNRFDSCIYYYQKALLIDPGLNAARENMSKAQNALLAGQKH